jgi:hypothetical protein
VGDVLPGVLRGLGVPSKALSRRVRDAWDRVADPAWAGRARPERLQAGVLTVAVTSAPLREELMQFHAERLLAALRHALPDDSLTSLRFTAGAERTR